jgi:drug/metabolite transporter (DMT)-like permease
MTLGNVIAALVCAPWLLRAPPTEPREWGILFALGAFQIALPYLLYARAVRALPALESSLLASIEPILSPVWVVIATGERPARSALFGGALIVAAVTFQATKPKAPEPTG